MDDQTRRVTGEEGQSGTRRVDEGATLHVEEQANVLPGTSAGQSLGMLAPGARLCDEFDVIETLVPHERRLPGVYLCRTAGGQQLIIKVYAQEYPPDRALWARLPALDHPNLLHIFDTIERDGHCYEVQEYCNAGTLQQFIPRPGSGQASALPETQVHILVHELNAALSYLHGQGIVHRDVKPSNIYFRRGEHGGLVAVLGDFDISSLLDQSRTSRTTARAGGTWTYTAPESFPRFMDETGHIGAQITRAGDYYALGVSLLELIMGTTSLHTCGLADLYDFYLQGQRVVLPDGIPTRLAILLRGLLILNRHERWGAAEIERWLHDAGTEADLQRVNADEHYSVGRAARPYRMKEQTAYDLKGLSDIMLKEPQIALDDLMSGDILINWIAEQDTNIAREVKRLREWWRQQPPVALWCTVLCCDPAHPFTFPDGAAVCSLEEWFAHETTLADGQLTPDISAFSDASLLGLEVWLSLKTDPQPEAAERIKTLRETPLLNRFDEMAFIIDPDRPLEIDKERQARLPAEFARLAYGSPEDWRLGAPAFYQTAMQRWQSGLLATWLRHHNMKELLADIAEVEATLGKEQPAAAFETILRLLDPSLPKVLLEVDRTAYRGVRNIPFGVTRRMKLPYRAIGSGVPFGVFTSSTPTEEIALEDMLVTQRSGTLTVVIDIDQEPFDCNVHQVELRLESGFTRLTGDPCVLWYRMTVMAYLTWAYVLVGGVIGLLFFLLPRMLAANLGQAGYAWIVLFAVIAAEAVAGRAIWVRAILEQSASRRAAETNRQLLTGVRDAIQSGVDNLTDNSGCGYGYGMQYGCGLFLALIGGLLWVSGVATRYVVQGCDTLFSAAGLLPASPFVLWALWGSLFGMLLGYWHVAPLHNLGRWRGWFIAGLVAVLLLLYFCGSSGR